MISLEKKEELTEQMKKLDQRIRVFSFIRLVLVLAIIVFVICLISLDNPVLYGSLSAGLLVLTVVFCIFTRPAYHELKLLKNLEQAYKIHENRRKLAYHGFTPDGKEWIDYNHYMELDLDLLGPRSLFQYLCCARSKEGRRKLALQLTKPEKKEQKFTDCVKALANSTESLRLEASIRAISNDAKDCDQDELLGITNKKIKIPFAGLAFMIASYLICIILLVVFLLKNIGPYPLLFFIPINFVIVRLFNKNDVFAIPATKYADLLEAYQVLAQDVIALKLDDPYFQEIQAKLSSELPTLIKFKHLFEMLSYRRNALLSIIGNGIFYLDYIIAAIFNQRTKHLSSIQDSLDDLSELELMLSLAVIGLDHEIYCTATYSNQIQIEGGYHPLVRNCVPNELFFQGGIILTGSNMSGKTTFMRMLGLNQVLANAGGLVCAKRFETIEQLLIVTSLRATDMLQEGISTFYAEVNRMKAIMQVCKEQKALVLVDEIFKGTNAKDRIFAAFKIIEKLNGFQVPFIITTHDFELCDAKDIENYHFDEQYEDDQIKFDYTIKKGKCFKTNALYLLKMAGVLESQE